MEQIESSQAKKAAGLATWIVIQVVERNPDYFSSEKSAQESETRLDESLQFAEQKRYDEAFAVMKKYLGKVLAQAPHLIKDDSELLEALGALSQLDHSFGK